MSVFELDEDQKEIIKHVMKEKNIDKMIDYINEWLWDAELHSTNEGYFKGKDEGYYDGYDACYDEFVATKDEHEALAKALEKVVKMYNLKKENDIVYYNDGSGYKPFEPEFCRAFVRGKIVDNKYLYDWFKRNLYYNIEAYCRNE